MEQLCRLLLPIVAVIQALQADTHPTMSTALFLITSLKTSINTFARRNNLEFQQYEVVKEFLNNLKRSFESRLNLADLPDHLLVSFMLDIRLKDFSRITDTDTLLQTFQNRGNQLLREAFRLKHLELNPPIIADPNAESDSDEANAPVHEMPDAVPLAHTVLIWSYIALDRILNLTLEIRSDYDAIERSRTPTYGSSLWC
jgi:hypothetical protein